MEWVTAREMTVGWMDEYQTQDKDVEWVKGWWGGDGCEMGEGMVGLGDGCGGDGEG